MGEIPYFPEIPRDDAPDATATTHRRFGKFGKGEWLSDDLGTHDIYPSASRRARPLGFSVAISAKLSLYYCRNDCPIL